MAKLPRELDPAWRRCTTGIYVLIIEWNGVLGLLQALQRQQNLVAKLLRDLDPVTREAVQNRVGAAAAGRESGGGAAAAEGLALAWCAAVHVRCSCPLFMSWRPREGSQVCARAA